VGTPERKVTEVSLTEPQAAEVSHDAGESSGPKFQFVSELVDAIGSDASVVIFGSNRVVRPDEMTDAVRAQFADGLRAAARRTMESARAVST
jgi:hypothetical protein